MDLITIGIPIYNVEKYVERALLSALNQTYPHIEYIIVDDKGTDHSMKIVEQIKNVHPRGSMIKIIDHVTNRYLGATRNTAIDSATGRYIFFLDSDDEITPDCIEILYNEIIRTNADVVGGCRKMLKGNVTVSQENFSDNVIKGEEQVVLSYFNNTTSLFNTNKLYKLSFLKDNHLRVSLGTIEDINFSFNVVLKAAIIAVVSKITYLYYLHGGTISGETWNEKIYAGFIDVFKEENELIKDANWPVSLRIKVKKKFFAQRLNVANNALKSQYNVQRHIQNYLGSDFFGKDIWKSATLFAMNLYSQMSLGLKKITIPVLMSVKKMLK